MLSFALTFSPPAVMTDSKLYWLDAATVQQLHLQKPSGSPFKPSQFQ